MSEFKFACPVCGQHITAGVTAVGSQISCPTCFRKIVVPQAPASADPKFILSAAEANKPRPIPAASLPRPEETPNPRKRSYVPLALAAILVVAGAAGTTLFVIRGKASRNHDSHEAKGKAQPEGLELAPDIPTNKLAWILDLADTDYPTETVSGRIHGRDFVCERASLQGGTLTLRRGRTGAPDLGVSIYFFVKQAEELVGKSLSVTTNNTRSPRVVVRWKDGNETRMETLRSDYALKLEFGDIVAGRVPGKIYLCLPDQSQSCVAGTFNAEIRRPNTRTPPAPTRR